MGNDGTALACFRAYNYISKSSHFKNWDKTYFSITSWKFLLDWRPQLSLLIEKQLSTNDITVIFGGNHLLALPIYDLLSQDLNSNLSIRFDSHTDFEHPYDPDRIYTGNFMCEVDSERVPIFSIGPLTDQIKYHYQWSVKRIEQEYNLFSNELDSFLLSNENLSKTLFIDFDVDILDAKDFSSTMSQPKRGLPAHFIKKICTQLPHFQKKIMLVCEMNSHSNSFEKDLHLLIDLISLSTKA